MAGPNIARGAQERAAKSVAAVRPTDLTVAGLGGAAFDPATGQVTLTQDPRMQANMRMLDVLGKQQGGGAGALAGEVTGYGQQALGTAERLLSEAGGFDPLAAAEQRFQRLQSVLQPERERRQQALESRLFKQGRLDSTGGYRGQADLEAALAREDAMLLDRQFQEAEQARQAALTGGLQAGAGGTTAQQSQFQQFLQALGAQGDVAAAPLRVAGVSQDIAASEAARRAAASGAIGNFNTTMAGTAQGGFGAALGGIVGGIGGAMAAPYLGIDAETGARAGSTLGGNLGSFL